MNVYIRQLEHNTHRDTSASGILGGVRIERRDIPLTRLAHNTYTCTYMNKYFPLILCQISKCCISFVP